MAAPNDRPPVSLSPIPEEPRSDKNDPIGAADTEPVMAESRTGDVVNQALSVGDLSPADVARTHQHDSTSTGRGETELGEQGGISTGENSNQAFQRGGPVQAHTSSTASVRMSALYGCALTNKCQVTTSSNGPLIQPTNMYTNGAPDTSNLLVDDKQGIAFNDNGGSDTDTSRNEGMRGSQLDGSNVQKKSSFKPVSFAKYSVNKGGSASPALKSSVEKGTVFSSVHCH